MLLKSSIFDGAVLLLSKLWWFNHCLITLNHDVCAHVFPSPQINGWTPHARGSASCHCQCEAEINSQSPTSMAKAQHGSTSTTSVSCLIHWWHVISIECRCMQGFYLECRNLTALAATSDVFAALAQVVQVTKMWPLLLCFSPCGSLMAVQGPPLTWKWSVLAPLKVRWDSWYFRGPS